MIDSILTSVKKFCHIDENYEFFDPDIIMYINSNLNELNQLGVGVRGFAIYDKLSTWHDFLQDDEGTLNMAIEFVQLSVRLMFDPPAGSTVSSYENRIAELTWRLNVQVDPGVSNSTSSNDEK